MGGDLIDRYDAAFTRLAKSKFRSRFHRSSADRKYIAEKGMKTIRSHCEDFIRTRLAPYPPLAGAATRGEAATPSGLSEAKRLRESRANPSNDGKQTPMRGHPVFKAQHACACCCRDCLAKWWKVPRGTTISVERQRGIVDFLMAWIERELAK